MSIVQMHRRAKLLSLEQRRQVQLLNLMFIYKNRHENARRIHGRNNRAANIYSLTRERYHNNKYKNSPYYKGAFLWDSLPISVRQSVSLSEFKGGLKRVYHEYNDHMS